MELTVSDISALHSARNAVSAGPAYHDIGDAEIIGEAYAADLAGEFDALGKL